MNGNEPIDTTHMVALCGHNDILGYLMHTYCKDCADKGHRQVVRTGKARKAKVRA